MGLTILERSRRPKIETQNEPKRTQSQHANHSNRKQVLNEKENKTQLISTRSINITHKDQHAKLSSHGRIRSRSRNPTKEKKGELKHEDLNRLKPKKDDSKKAKPDSGSERATGVGEEASTMED